jgi:methylthioribulose 1-phosphate dehydratase/enolase-phosphatase E1
MTPSGVPKERIEPEDLFVLDVKGNMLAVPSRKPGSVKPPKLSGGQTYSPTYFAMLELSSELCLKL